MEIIIYPRHGIWYIAWVGISNPLPVDGVVTVRAYPLYVKQEEKITQLDVKVQQLQIDKVSKQELREMEERISKSMDGMKGDIIFHINMLREKR